MWKLEFIHSVLQWPQKDGLTGKICKLLEHQNSPYPVSKWTGISFWHRHKNGNSHSESPTGAVRTPASWTPLPVFSLYSLHKNESVANMLSVLSQKLWPIKCSIMQDQISVWEHWYTTILQIGVPVFHQKWVWSPLLSLAGALHMDTHRMVADTAKIWSPTAS